jgi:phosphoglycolate phosphatase
MATFIFDFDGTLADTFPLVVDISYELSSAKRLPKSEIEKLRRLPLLEAVRALGVSTWKLPKLILQTRRRMYPRIHEAPAFPGMAETLRKLHADGHTLLVLTSNHRRNALTFLRTHELNNYFSDIVGVFYGNVFFKVYGLRKLLHRNHLQVEECFYVGNEALDMEAAELVGIRAVATTWAGHNRTELSAAKPFKILDEPKELLGLVKKQ